MATFIRPLPSGCSFDPILTVPKLPVPNVAPILYPPTSPLCEGFVGGLDQSVVVSCRCGGRLVVWRTKPSDDGLEDERCDAGGPTTGRFGSPHCRAGTTGAGGMPPA